MAATAILESVWTYAGVAVVGVYSGLDGSPLSWVAAMAVLGISLIVARTLAMVMMPVWLPYLIQMVAGSLVIYLTMASQVQSGGQVFDLGWLSAVSSDTAPTGYPFSVGLAGFFGALLWWRGGRLASVDYPVEQLSSSFRIGIIVLGSAAFVDAFHPADLKIFPLMFVFFVSGLVGLSVGHLMPASSKTAGQRAWPRVIGAVVGMVVVVGLLFSLLQHGVLTLISTPAVWLIKALATAILIVVVVPIAYIFTFLISGLFNLLIRGMGEAELPDFELPEGLGEAFLALGDEVEETGTINASSGHRVDAGGGGHIGGAVYSGPRVPAQDQVAQGRPGRDARVPVGGRRPHRRPGSTAFQPAARKVSQEKARVWAAASPMTNPRSWTCSAYTSVC